MPLKFYFDTHIAKSAATQLRAKGVDVMRSEEVGMAEASDEEHLKYAAQEVRILVSQDADYSDIHAKWQQSKQSHAVIMRIPRDLQGEAQISFVVNELLFMTRLNGQAQWIITPKLKSP